MRLRHGGALWAAVLAAALATATAAAETVEGEAQKLGEGSARIYAELEGGRIKALGVSFEAGMLDGLPKVPNSYSRCFDRNGNGRIDDHHECNGDFELAFALPDAVAGRTDMPFSWITVNWNPEGHPHPAPPPWAVPHFDFHFYILPETAVRAIRAGACAELIDCEDFKKATKPVPARFVHADHIDVGAAVPEMGNHLIDSKSPELQPGGPPFTRTFIYGAYDGHVTFYEPMITHAYLASRPTVCAELKLPAAWERPGAYPTRYCVRYHAGDKRYTVSLEDFVAR